MAGWRDHMQSPVGKFAREASGSVEPKTNEMFTNVQVANLEPQEFMEFLEFCAEKIAMAQARCTTVDHRGQWNRIRFEGDGCVGLREWGTS
jgi:hypothetical protein